MSRKELTMSKDMLGVAVRKLVTLPIQVLGVVCDLLEKLSDPKWVEATKKFLRKENPWVKYIVDLDTDPMIPDGWTIETHIKGGQFEFDPEQVMLYLDETQQDGGTIIGHELRKKLEGKVVYNANLLDFYLANPQFIPEEWKGRSISFWGTIYRYSSGNLYVRCLDWDGGRWEWYFHWLGGDFRGRSPVVIPASN